MIKTYSPYFEETYKKFEMKEEKEWYAIIDPKKEIVYAISPTIDGVKKEFIANNPEWKPSVVFLLPGNTTYLKGNSIQLVSIPLSEVKRFRKISIVK